jgi:hypothetical protein
MKWITNADKDRTQRYLRGGYIVDRPKPTSRYTVEELESFRTIGVYVEEKGDEELNPYDEITGQCIDCITEHSFKDMPVPCSNLRLNLTGDVVHEDCPRVGYCACGEPLAFESDTCVGGCG